MKLRKAWLLLLALCLTVSCLAHHVSAAETTASGTMGDTVTWTLDSEGTLTISGTGATSGSIPSANRSSVKTVVVKSGITGIGASAFSNCSKLTSVSLPYGLKTIGDNAFYWCTNLTAVEIPNTVTTIGRYAFQASGLTTVKLPNSVTEVGDSAFANCTKLTGVTLSTAMTTLNDGLFSWCTTLAEFELPANITTINGNPFSGTALDRISVHANNRYFKNNTSNTADGSLYSADMTTLVAVQPTQTGAFTVPYSVQTIGQDAFHTSKVTKVVLPSGVKTIGKYAFMASDLAEINLPGTVTSVEAYAFAQCYDLKCVVFPDSAVLSERIFNMCSGLEQLVLPGNLTVIPSGLCSECTKLTDISIPASVTTISYNAFSYCESLRTVFFEGDPPQTIDSYSFYKVKADAYTPAGNTAWTSSVKKDYGGKLTWHTQTASGSCGDTMTWNLGDDGTLIISGSGAMTDYTASAPAPWSAYEVSRVTMTGDITHIGSYAFRGKGMYEITVPSTVSSIGTMAFAECTGLKKINFKGAAPSMNNYVFYKVTADAFCPESWASSARKNYGGTLNWRSSLGSGVAGPNAYWNVSSDGTMYIYGSGITYDNLRPWYENHAGQNSLDNKITSLVFEEGITHIGAYFCDYLFNVGSITLPETLESIGPAALEYIYVDEIVIPASVKTIETGAFNCSGASRVWFRGSAPTFGASVFLNCDIGVLYPKGDESWNIDVFATVADEDGYDHICWFEYDDAGVYGSGELTADLTWSVHEDTLTLTGSGEMGVAGADDIPWIGVQSLIRSVSLPEGLTDIGGYAFLGFSGIEEIALPSTVTSIGNAAFRECSGLEDIQLPDGLTYLGSNAFYGCSSLAEISIPNGVAAIETSTFSFCDTLVSVTLPDGLASIGSNAFNRCASLQTLDIPASVTSIANYAFQNSTALTEVTVGGAPSIGNKAFYGDTALTTVTFAADPPAFSENTFGEVTVTARYPEDNDNWTGDVLQNYGGTVTWEPYTVNTCGPDLTWTLDENGTLTISGTGPMDKWSTTSAAPWPADAVRSVVVEEGVKTIGDYAFANCFNLTSASLPSTLAPDDTTISRAIGFNAFENCTALESIVIPEGSAVLNGTFRGCTALKNIALPSTLTCLNGVFYGCTALETLTLPDGLTELGAYAFYKCAALRSIDIPDTVTVLGKSAFEGCTALSHVNLPNAVQTLPTYLFRDCISLQSVDIPDSVLNINLGVFSGCTALNGVVLPEDLRALGKAAFSDCASLTAIEVPDKITVLDSAFSGCTNLKQVTLPGSLTEIGAFTFMNCKALETLEIPDTVKTIGESAFAFSALKNVYFHGSAPTISGNAFYGVTAAATYYVDDTWTADVLQNYGGTVTWVPVYTGTCGSDLTWTLDENGTLTISGTGVMWSYTVVDPAPWDVTLIRNIEIHEGVTAIGDEAFSGSENLETVSLPSTLTSIGNAAFMNCTSLKEAALPEGVTTMEHRAFVNCSALASVTIPKTMTSIGNFSFYGCSALTEIVIPDGVTQLGNGVFDSCSALKKAVLPKSLTSINKQMFSGCGALTEVEIPSGVTSIGDYAFQGSGVTSLTFPAGLESIGQDAFFGCNALKNVYFHGSAPTISGNAFYGVTAAATYYVDDTWTADVLQNYGGTVTWIGVNALGDNASWYLDESTGTLYLNGTGVIDEIGSSGGPWDPALVKHAVFGEGLTGTGAYTLSGCANLESVTLPSTIKSIGSDSFLGCTKLAAVEFPDGLDWIGYGAFKNCTALEEITVPDSVTFLDRYAFYNCTGLKSVRLPDAWQTLPQGVFQGCSALESVNLPSALTKIESNAFYGCKRLAGEIVLQDTVTEIGGSAFAYCESLTSVTLPKTLRHLYGYLFSGCTSLKTIELPENLLTVQIGAFKDCTALESIVVPDTVSTFGSGVFTGCTNLQTAVLPSGLTEIPNYTFEGCSSLKNFTFPAGTKTIGVWAFYDCSSLAEIDLPDGLQTIQNGTFSGCDALTEVILPDTVTTVMDAAFSHCDRLQHVTLPKNLTEIVSSMFSHCYALQEIEIPDTVTSIGKNAFRSCDSLTEITLPDSVKTVGEYAFAYCIELKKAKLSAGITEISPYLFLNAPLKSVVIPEGVTTIGKSAFKNTKLSSVTFPSTVTTIGEKILENNNIYLEKITFLGAAPTFDAQAFYAVTAKAQYTYGDSWTEDKLQNYGGTITWSPIYKGTCGDRLSWTLDAEGTLTISGTGAMTSNPWAEFADEIRKVVVEEGVESVTDYAFNCGRLLEVSLPDTLKSIGSYAFAYTDRLTSIKLPDTVDTLGNNVFSDSGIREIEIPGNVETIPAFAFADCAQLTSVVIPNSVTYIDMFAFTRCNKLESVEIPGSVEVINSSAFNQCAALKSVTLAEGVKTIGLSAFSACYALQEISLPSGLTCIAANAFNCCDLRSVVVPEGIKYLNETTFANNVHLTSVQLPSTLLEIGKGCFVGCGSLAEIDLPNALEYIDESAFSGTGLTEITVPASVETVADTAFADIGTLTSVSFEGAAPAIGTDAFRDVTAKMLYYPGNTWTEDVLQNYGGTLTWVPVYEGMCGENLTWRLCDGVLTVSGEGAMTDYTGFAAVPWAGMRYDIHTVIIEDGVTSLGDYAFAVGANIKEVSLPDSLLRIGRECFSGCMSLAELELPSNITEIGEGALAGTALTELVLPDSVQSLSGFVLSSCMDLKKVTMPQSITKIPVAMFSDCPALETVVFNEDALTEIGVNAFSGCKSLREFTVPASVKTIGINAFRGCTGLKKIIFKGSAPETFDVSVFDEVSANAYYPKGNTTWTECFRTSLGGDLHWYPDGELTVRFLDYNGEEISSAVYSGGDTVEIPADPYRPADMENTYTFAGWTPAVSGICMDDAVYTATYAAEPIEYRVTFLNYDGTVLQESTLYYGDAVSAPETPTRPADEMYTYEFAGWDKTVSEFCTGNVVYTAVYTAKLKLRITVQPTDTEVASGETAEVTLTAVGEGLTYTWYYANAGSDDFTVTTSFTGNRYAVAMSAARAGRRVYCVVTDAYGNSVQSDTAELRMTASVLAITAEPKSSYTKQGATAQATVTAEGEGLTYQWYIKNAGAAKYSKSSITSNTYSAKMSSKVKDRLIYCIVTDAAGNTVRSKTVRLRMAATITAQSKTTYTKQGATAKATVTAVGDGLTYQWYIKNAGATKYSKSSITSSTYSAKMSSKVKDRLVYCIVTDQYGKTARSETVRLRMAATITEQPVSVTVAAGEQAKVTLTAVGDGLTYTWYYKNAGAASFSKTSSFTGPSYYIEMTAARSGREVYCVVTDQYGKTAQTDVVSLNME